MTARPWRALVAPNAFKGTLSAGQAAAALAAGLARARPSWTLDVLPLADGGPGTLEAVQQARGGRWRRARTVDALGHPCSAHWLDLGAGLAVVESAEAIGLTRLPQARRDALRAGSEGLGLLLRAVSKAGVRRVLVGLGGSACTDGGVGLARVLGWRFLDKDGKDLGPGGGPLLGLAQVVAPKIKACGPLRIEVLCDVDAPLFGPRGAARVYAPQKGASAAQTLQLDAGLRRLARYGPAGLAQSPGAGAAGGLGWGLQAFLGARLRPGASTLLRLCGFRSRLRQADLLITGEGRLDAQSLQGKLPVVVAGRAKAAGKPCVAVVGSCGLREAQWRRAGFTQVIGAPARTPAGATRALRRAVEADAFPFQR